MLINQALAQTAETAEMLPEGTGMKLLFQFAIIFAIFYFILIRPQTKRMKEHKKEISAIGKGDKIICGGIVGKVTKVEDSELEVEIASGVKVTMMKDMVATVVDKANAPANTNVKAANKGTKAEKLEKALTSDDEKK